MLGERFSHELKYPIVPYSPKSAVPRRAATGDTLALARDKCGTQIRKWRIGHYKIAVVGDVCARQSRLSTLKQYAAIGRSDELLDERVNGGRAHQDECSKRSQWMLNVLLPEKFRRSPRPIRGVVISNNIVQRTLGQEPGPLKLSNARCKNGGKASSKCHTVYQ